MHLSKPPPIAGKNRMSTTHTDPAKKTTEPTALQPLSSAPEVDVAEQMRRIEEGSDPNKSVQRVIEGDWSHLDPREWDPVVTGDEVKEGEAEGRKRRRRGGSVRKERERERERGADKSEGREALA